MSFRLQAVVAPRLPTLDGIAPRIRVRSKSRRVGNSSPMTDENDPNIVGLDDPNLTLEAVRRGAEQVVTRLKRLSESVGPTSKSAHFYVRHRVKGGASIREKILTQQRAGFEGKNPHFSFRDVTDYVGLRFVTLYNDDLIRLVDYVFELVATANQLQQPIFCPDSPWTKDFQEAYFLPQTLKDKNDIYRGCHQDIMTKLKDLLSSESPDVLKDVLSKCDEQERLDLYGRLSPYSAAHIRFHARSYDGAKTIYIPMEIQLRTVADDIWSEISHEKLYKSSNSYLWTRESHEDFELANNASIALKRYLRGINSQVKEVAQRSKTITEGLENAWAVIDSPEYSKYHASLCMSLYFVMSGGSILGEISSSIERYTQSFSKMFDRDLPLYNRVPFFESAIAELELIRASHERLEGEVVTELSAYEKQHAEELKSDDPSSHILEQIARRNSYLSLHQQAIRLMKLEIVRIRSYFFRDYKTYNEGLTSGATGRRKATNHRRKMLNGFRQVMAGGINPARARDGFSEEVARSLYLDLCEQLDDSLLKIRPMAMGYYWKYFISRIFDRNIAIKNLGYAYEELSTGSDSLPPWSIYRSRIPRTLAIERLTDTQMVLQSFTQNELSSGSMVRLRSDSKEALVNSLLYAAKAMEFDKEDFSEQSVDLFMGSGKKEAPEHVEDAVIVLDIYLYYEYCFDESIAVGQNSIANIVETAVSVVRMYLKERSLSKFYRRNITFSESQLRKIEISIRSSREKSLRGRNFDE